MAGPQFLHLFLGGDTMLGRGVNEVILRRGPDYPLQPLAAVFERADLFFVNLECAISQRNVVFSGRQKAFYFRADPVAVETLTFAGVDLVSLANNHALDADYDGLRDTLATLDRYGLAYAGAGEDIRAARQPVVAECEGLRTGVLAYCDHQSDFAAGRAQPGIRYVDLGDPGTPGMLAREVEALAEEVDLVVVSMHWQPNWAPHVARRYQALAHRLVEAGAHVVWGHSPHHLGGRVGGSERHSLLYRRFAR